MKLLIIGDDLSLTGGVVNYTKPLFETFRRKLYDVDYLTTSTFKAEYNFFKFSKIIKGDNRQYKLINSEIHYRNRATIDREIYHEASHNLILDFIKNQEYDVVHIHSNLGIPVSVYKPIVQSGVKLFITVHEYYWLCPKRVMIDYLGKNCEGPTDLDKCSSCVRSSMKSESDFTIKLRSTLSEVAPFTLPYLVRMKKLLASNKRAQRSESTNNQRLDIIENRFHSMIESLNQATKVLCVSQDVVDHLSRFGVAKDKLIRQHIGSQIANTQTSSFKKISDGRIKIGFIGGITYYKGVHLLVDAFLKLPLESIANAELHLYGKYEEGYMQEMQNSISKYPVHSSKVIIHGRYPFEDLPVLLESLSINVLPSLCADTAPQTIFESFSRNIPVIGPDIGGFKDFIVHDVNGLIFSSGDANDLSSCLLKVLSQPELVESYSENIPRLKNLDENMRELLSLYEN